MKKKNNSSGKLAQSWETLSGGKNKNTIKPSSPTPGGGY
jgi:hypothetical protein